MDQTNDFPDSLRARLLLEGAVHVLVDQPEAFKSRARELAVELGVVFVVHGDLGSHRVWHHNSDSSVNRSYPGRNWPEPWTHLRYSDLKPRELKGTNPPESLVHTDEAASSRPPTR